MMKYFSLSYQIAPHRFTNVLIYLASTVLLSCLVIYFGARFVVAALALVSMLVLLPNLFISFLCFLCFLPTLGNLDTDQYLPYIWLFFYGIFVASWLYNVLTCPKRIYFNVPLTLLYLSFLLVCLLSLAYNYGATTLIYPLQDFLGYHRRLYEVLFSGSLLVLSMSACEKEEQLEKIFWLIVLTGIPYAVSIFFFGLEVEAGGVIGRHAGFFGEPHTAATYMMICTIVALSLFGFSTKKTSGYLILIVLLFLFAEFFTNSRTILVILFIVFLIYSFMEGGFKKLILYFTVFIIFLAASFPFTSGLFRESILTIFTALSGILDPSITSPISASTETHLGERMSTFVIRVDQAKIGLQLASQHPYLGVGLGLHQWIVDLPVVQVLHSYYMIVLVENGIIGLIIFLMIIFTTLFMGYRSYKFYRCINNKRMSSITRGLLLSFISIILMFIIQPGILEGERIFWVLIALLSIVDRLMKLQKLKIGEK